MKWLRKAKRQLFRKVQREIKIVDDNSKCLFETKEDAYNFLLKNVFSLDDFKEDIRDTALELDLGFDLVYNEITIYLTNVLYEIDKAQTRKSILKVNIAPYIFFRVSKKMSFQGTGYEYTFFYKMKEYLKKHNLNNLKNKLK